VIAVDHAAEPVKIRAPEMGGGGIPDFRRNLLIISRLLILSEDLAEQGGGGEAAEYRAHREAQNAPAFFPEVIGGGRQAGFGIPVLTHKIRGFFHQGPIQGLDEIQVTVEDKVLPEGPDYQGGGVLLDG
jgi:hypothetical protein